MSTHLGRYELKTPTVTVERPGTEPVWGDTIVRWGNHQRTFQKLADVTVSMYGIHVVEPGASVIVTTLLLFDDYPDIPVPLIERARGITLYPNRTADPIRWRADDTHRLSVHFAEKMLHVTRWRPSGEEPLAIQQTAVTIVAEHDPGAAPYLPRKT